MDKQYKDWSPWIKYGAPLALALFAAIWGVYIHFNPNTPNTLDTDWINIESIFSKMDKSDTSLEKSNFIEKYQNSNVIGEGVFLDLYGISKEYYRVQLNSSGRPISCSFDLNDDIEQRLLILKKGQKITFSGKFTNSHDFGIGWSIEDCRLLDAHSSNYFLRLFELIKSRLQGF